MTTSHKSITLAIALQLMTSGCAHSNSSTLASGSPLVGAWRMTSLEVADGGGFRTVPHSGQIVFTDAGTMSVQAMDPNPAAGPTPFSINGYEAFYGPVTINLAEKTFVVTIESSVVRSLIGTKLERRFDVTGDRFVLTPVNPQEGFRVTYERVRR